MANHLEQVEQKLRELIAKHDAEVVVGWVKERVLESYKNGLASAKRKGTGAGRKEVRSSVTGNRGGNIAPNHGH